jgi:glutamate-1-semialdehyde aminotransferase
MIYTLHRYLLNHGVTIIPHGMMLLSTAMTDDDIDEMLIAMRDGMKVLAGAASE